MDLWYIFYPLLPDLERCLLIMRRLSLPHVSIRDATNHLLQVLAKQEHQSAMQIIVSDLPNGLDATTTNSKTVLHLSL
jgi:hypothetical protein